MSYPFKTPFCSEAVIYDPMSSSRLDELLSCQWDITASTGMLRTNVEDTMRRCVPGKLGLIVQFNPNHFQGKRPVDPQLLKVHMGDTFTNRNTSGFNFTLAKKAEFLSGLRFGTIEDQRLSSVRAIDIKTKKVEHFVLVNVAPLVRGHVLFLLDMDLVQPQKMTKKYMHYALGISREMQREDFALGFNSAGAWSSVNHFHLHGYFFPQHEDLRSVNFPVASQTREGLFRVGGVHVKHLPNWKTTCYVIEPEDGARDGAEVAEIAWTLLEVLQSEGIPHNLLVVGMVVFVFPRQLQRENCAAFSSDRASSDSDITIASISRLRIAVAELSGLVVVGDRADYENLTEDTFTTILVTQVSLSASEEAALTATWKNSLLSRYKVRFCDGNAGGWMSKSK
uniref:GDP-D-glucose phosphorylase 1 n=1 Tax=Peronospora matthiolae TaxID=2874970 RepID=A0AAV1UR43_9STRA